jgi:hypothetical protein
MDILRAKNAEVPHSKTFKSAQFIEDSDSEEEPHAGPSTRPGSKAGNSREDEDDSE